MTTIFYSWQSDLPTKYNRNFIETCLKKALFNIKRQEDYRIELNLDRDTKGVPGTPDIINTIFDKIANSEIFICDISIINKDSISKKSPNPNVLLELGYAAHALSWENIICVYNASFGKVENLPFDLKFRRPIIYQYSENDEKSKCTLVKQLELAIKSTEPELVEEKKRIKRFYSNESSKIQKLAVGKPDGWESKLIEALLIERLQPFNDRYTDIKKGIVFFKPRPINPLEFLEFVRNEMGNLLSIIEALGILVSKDLIAG